MSTVFIVLDHMLTNQQWEVVQEAQRSTGVWFTIRLPENEM